MSAHSLEAALKEWRETLKFVGISCESIKTKKPELDKLLSFLMRVANYEDLLPEQMLAFLSEIENHFDDLRAILDHPLAVFMEVYTPYLNGFTEAECEVVKNSITSEMFTSSATRGNAIVNKAAEDYRKNQVKTQLYKFWSDNTSGSKNPRDWSEKNRTPILCCMSDSQYADAKKAFSTINSNAQSESEIREALSFLQNADFFEKIAAADFRDKCFTKRIIGYYSKLLPDINRVRDVLESTGISAYEWSDNPLIFSKVSGLAEAEYNAGGSDQVVDVIEGMNDVELKRWLTDLVKKDMGLGIRIIQNREA